MELTAVIEALTHLETTVPPDVKQRISLTTDSKYVKDGVMVYMKTWKKNNWQRMGKNGKPGKPVLNPDLWKKLDGLQEKFFISWKWIKAHNGLDEEDKRNNDVVDKLAQEEARSL